MGIALRLVLIAFFPGTATGDIITATQRATSEQFDAKAEVRCAQEVGQSLGNCGAKVSRAGESSAVIVSFPNGFARTLMFSKREFLRGNATMSGVGTDTNWHLSGGIYQIRIDDQRFEIPEVLVFGN